MNIYWQRFRPRKHGQWYATARLSADPDREELATVSARTRFGREVRLRRSHHRLARQLADETRGLPSPHTPEEKP